MSTTNQNTPPVELTAEEKLAAALAQIEAMKQNETELLAINADIQSKLETAALSEGKLLPVVKHGSKNYQVLAAKFSVEGVEYTAADLKDNKDLVAQLVSIESGILAEVKTEAKK